MSYRPTILVVAPPDGAVGGLTPVLQSAGYHVQVVNDFGSAKESLSTRPELLITELKLGAHNGLHLAIRASARGTPVIIVGDPDPVLEAEAGRQHAAYLTPAVAPSQILSVVDQILSASQRVRRSPRKHVPLIGAFANGVRARVIDVSYEGIRLEATSPQTDALPSQFKIRLPLFNFSFDVERVWVSPLTGENGASTVWCGATLAANDVDTAMTWRTLVDAMPGLAVTA